MDEIHLIVGLGNPGRKYERTRHNAGFWWVDAIASRKRAEWRKESKFSGYMTIVEEGGHLFRLLKPDTYMNESGRSVAALQRFFHIDPMCLLVVHDELDLPPGTVKMKKGGGTGGHNGLEDLADVLGTKDFWRLRIGIGHPGARGEVAAYVLRKPPAAERQLIEANVDESLKALDLLLAGQMDKAMMKIHAKPPRPKPPRPADASAATVSSASPAGPVAPGKPGTGTQEPAE